MPSTRKIVRVRTFLPDVEGRNWVYPQKIAGRFTRFRGRLTLLLFAIMFVTPFVRVDGLPAILFDIPHRRFIVLGQIFWPHDLWLLVFLGVAVIVAVILFTALFGRVWCGYACPQSVFYTQVFLRIERWIEGDRNAQIKLDAAPWTAGKVGKKAFKHGLFLVFSSIVAHTFLAYFMDVRELSYGLLHPGLEYKTPILFTSFVTGLFYLDFAFLREQFCNYLCPYARFQSALLDEDSLIVTYDPERGEPRGKAAARQATGAAAHGDCIDCTKCVVVCPQGIDIREGLQLDCIHCAACIDACDDVMERIGKPRGLIRYASEHALEHVPQRVWRPRTILYTVLMLAAAAAFVLLLSQRRLIEATLLRPPGPVYTTTVDGAIANHFRVQLVNKDRGETAIRLRLVEPAGWSLVTPHNPVPVAAGSLKAVELFVTAPPAAIDGRRGFRIVAEDALSGASVELRGRMIVPLGGADAPAKGYGVD